MKNIEITDDELIKFCLKNSRLHQELLYKKYSPKMYGVCLGYTNSKEQAKDILQEGFIKVFASLNKFSGNGSFEGWIRKIIVNIAIDYYRQSLRDLNKEEIVSALNMAYECTILSDLNSQEIINLINKLPEGARIIFNLYTIEGYSHIEISKMLDISQGTSKSQVSRAKSILKTWINKLYPDSFSNLEFTHNKI